jgi:uncharacterized protein (TIGR03790 family)
MNSPSALSTALLVLASLAPSAFALGPEDVYILVNKNVPDSQAVADYYCAKRGVPIDHVIALDLPAGEDISRADYDAKLAGPLRDKIKDKRDKVKVLLTVYGVPLRVGGQAPNADEKAELDKLRKEMAPLEKRRKELDDEIKGLEAKAKDDPKGKAADDLKARRMERADLENGLRPLEGRRRHLSYDESNAAVDSELALLWHEGYDLRRWQLNLLYFQVPEEARKGKPPMLMTCRLDGPNVALVKRLIDQAVETEAKGLQGKVYVDARGIKYNPADGGFGYGGYDESMREMAKLLENEGKMSVILDDKPELFAPGSCPDCALYCGWYSLANYVDCCKFTPGAVAWHLASSEAVSLRDPKSKLWCKSLLEHGAAATLGPVAEPYTIGFPKPAEFFGTLVTGDYTLVETYWRTEMFASWMTVVIGDPLYNPYAKSPKLKMAQVKPSPAGAAFPLKKEGK